MLLVITSSSDPELDLLKSRRNVAIVVPAHLSQSGWSYEVGKGAHARLITSRGSIRGSDVSGVVTRAQRPWPADLPHIVEADRDYVASEMTAFLAALVNDLPCPLFNRPAANSLLGPPWTIEHWWRVATQEGFRVCCQRDGSCEDLVKVLVLDGDVIHDGKTVPVHAGSLVSRLAVRAGVRFLQADFCVSHGGLRRVSMRPSLDHDLLDMIEHRC